jgi:predicted transcriptional regulator
MKRTTLSLPDNIAGALAREARRRGVSVSQVAREALEAQLLKVEGNKRVIPFAAIGRSGYHDTSENIDELLAERDFAGDR